MRPRTENLNLHSDEELMNLYQAGDFAAFEILYKRHSGRVLEYLKKKISLQVAQDLLQEIFEKLHRSRAKYNSQYPFLPWLFTISRNSLYDYFKAAETKALNFSVGTENLIDKDPKLSAEPALPNIAAVLESLPDQQRRAIELRYLHEWSFEKIAKDIHSSEANVRQLISRGIRRLREVVGKKGWGLDEK